MFVVTFKEILFVVAAIMFLLVLSSFISDRNCRKRKEIIKRGESELLDEEGKFSAKVAEDSNNPLATEHTKILHVTMVIPAGFSFGILVKDIPGHYEWSVQKPFIVADRKEAGVQIVESFFKAYKGHRFLLMFKASGKYASKVIEISHNT